MARIEYGTTVDNAVTTTNALSPFDTADDAVEYHVWNSGAEPIKLNVKGNNDLVVSTAITKAEVSKHTGLVLAQEVFGNNVILGAGDAIELTVTSVTPDADDIDNTVTMTVSGIHTEVGLEDNLIYIARIVDTDSGFDSAL